MLGFLAIALFAAGQGAAVFVTAYGAKRLLLPGLPKVVAMLLSYFVWAFGTVAVFGALGVGGLMEGLGLLLVLLGTAAISTLVYLLIWSFVR